MLKKWRAPAWLVFLMLFCTGCATTGQDFDYSNVDKIKKGQTSREDALRLFGLPHTKGIQNGRDMWTYEFNKKHLGGELLHKSVVLIFDDKGKVIAYNHESNFP